MESNPYAAPADTIQAAPVESIRVDGNQIVVKTDAVLPALCVKTNEPVSQSELQTKDYYWCTPVIAITLIVGGPLIYLVLYLILRKKCRLTFGLSRETKRKFRNRLILKIALVVVTLIAIPVSIGMVDSPVVGLAGIFIFIGLFIWMCFGNSPLIVTKHENGYFWIKGCSPQFLSRLEA